MKLEYGIVEIRKGTKLDFKLLELTESAGQRQNLKILNLRVWEDIALVQLRIGETDYVYLLKLELEDPKNKDQGMKIMGKNVKVRMSWNLTLVDKISPEFLPDYCVDYVFFWNFETICLVFRTGLIFYDRLNRTAEFVKVKEWKNQKLGEVRQFEFDRISDKLHFWFGNNCFSQFRKVDYSATGNLDLKELKFKILEFGENK